MTSQGWLVVIGSALYLLWRGYRRLCRYPHKLCTYPGCDGGRLKSRTVFLRRKVSGLCPRCNGSPWSPRGIGGG